MARLDHALLCIYAVGISFAEVKMPLAEVRMTRADRDDTFRLVTELNRKNEKPLTEAKLADAFELGGRDLSSVCRQSLSKESPSLPMGNRRDQIDEILSIVQDISRRLPTAASARVLWHPKPPRMLSLACSSPPQLK